MPTHRYDNPKVIYRTSGLQETGTGARRVRTGGVWGDAQTFTIDGLIDPDAFPLLEGEIAFRYSYQDYYSSAYGVGGDAYALKRVTAPLTFRYRKSENGSWSEEDINFANLARPITGPNTSNYNYHGLTRLLYAWKSQAVATVMTNGSAGSDLWFCK